MGPEAQGSHVINGKILSNGLQGGGEWPDKRRSGLCTDWRGGRAHCLKLSPAGPKLLAALGLCTHMEGIFQSTDRACVCICTAQLPPWGYTCAHHLPDAGTHWPF